MLYVYIYKTKWSILESTDDIDTEIRQDYGMEFQFWPLAELTFMY